MAFDENWFFSTSWKSAASPTRGGKKMGFSPRLSVTSRSACLYRTARQHRAIDRTNAVSDEVQVQVVYCTGQTGDMQLTSDKKEVMLSS